MQSSSSKNCSSRSTAWSEASGADGAFTQQDVQEALVGTELFHEGFHRAADDAALQRRALTCRTDDLAQ